MTCGKCDAANGHYTDVAKKTCPECHYSCKTCDGPAANNCLSCDKDSNRVHNEAEKTCKPCTGSTGTEKAKGTAACYETEKEVAGKCDISCKTCNGRDPDDCLTCHEKFERSDKKAETSTCEPVDFHTVDPEDPTIAIICDKSCGKKCKDTTP